MTTRTRIFWTLVAAQTAFLLGWTGYHEWVRQHSPLITLKGRPVDPQDLLRGDYMTLDYDISHAAVSGAAANVAAGGSAGADVWVLLERRDRYHVAVAASRERLTPGAGQILVRGMIGYRWRGGGTTERIAYGIERYFVPEGKGSPRFTLTEVEVSVSPAHRLYIRRLLLDGKQYP